MSPDHDTGQESTADSVETSVRVTVEDGGFQVSPQIANYEQFDVAARLAFPLPDGLEAGQISPSDSAADVWTVEDGELVLVDRIEWASRVERTVSIEGGDRSQVRALVEGATMELTDMEGTELTVHSDIQSEFPPRRPSSGHEEGGERTAAEGSSGAPDDGDEDGGSAGRTAEGESDLAAAQADDEADDFSDRSETSRRGSVDAAEDSRDAEQTPEAGSDGESETTGAGANEQSGRQETREPGSTDAVPDEPSTADSTAQPDTAGEADASNPGDADRSSTRQSLTGESAGDPGQTDPPSREGADPLAGLGPASSADASDESGAADAGASTFEWVDVESENGDSEPETRNTDGVLERLRSLFSE